MPIPDPALWNLAPWNLAAAWLGILLGMLTGAALGSRFADDDFLGGYASWPRRLLRLGHVSFFGLALLNLAFALTAYLLGVGAWMNIAGALLLFSAFAMPTACAVAAFNKRARWVFAAPVTAMLTSAFIVAAVAVRAALAGATP